MRGRRVVVVGGGVAGCAAALAAAGAGAEVTLLARAPGATALYAGAMEIAPSAAPPEDEPFHPFARLGLDAAALAEALDTACGGLIAALAGAGHPLAGDVRATRTYLDLHGRERPAQLVPVTVAGGSLERLRACRVAVVGVVGAGEYDAGAVVCALGSGAERVDVDLHLPPGASLTDVFDRPAPPIATGADVIAFPPGFSDLPERGVELLAAMPSPHGLRLQRALERALARAGVEVRRRDVTSWAGEGARLAAAGDVEGDEFVLATGRYIGGGLVKNGVVHEPLLDLGVFHEGQRVDRAHPARLRHLEYVSPEPAFRTGLLTDPELRPLGWDGDVRFENVRAAGSVLGGYDYGRGYGFGVPILTGWLAGAKAAAP